ncbi:MAG TPA: SCP2 sterol-binding domain-containing protein [Myxococcota bacterium]|nr:SCP2 sterol-binding domain-containing protein [Myxococcota bacterium]
MSEIKFKVPGEMNLLGYILRSLIERNLKTAPGARAFSKMKGTILVGASQMSITLEFTGGDLVMAVGGDKADTRVRGSMDTLLGVALGHGMVWPVLSGKLKVGGKVFRLLSMLKLMKVEKQK